MAVKIPVIWLNYTDAPARGYWDQGEIEDLFANRMGNTGYEFTHYDKFWGNNGGRDINGAVIVFAARNQVDFIDVLNNEIKHLDWVVLMLTGDEEAVFPVEQITHPNIKIWVMSPRKGRHDEYGKLGTGYPPQMHDNLPEEAPNKDLGWFFAGQITHERRQMLNEKAPYLLSNLSEDGEYRPSQSFTAGLEPERYFNGLSHAKVAPCPSGPETPDSFRLFEALECAAVPVVDSQPPREDFPDDYWTWFFGEEPPFPILRHYDHLQGYIEDMLNLYPVRNNQVSSWWQMKKYNFVEEVSNQIEELSGIPKANDWEDKITILISSSPINTHPSTEIIEACVRDVRVHLPNAQIIIMLDGVREEQLDMKPNYEEYQRKLLWLCNHKWTNVLPLRFEEFGHQSTMTKAALKLVKTPLILFVEHDTPLVPDFSMELPKLVEAIELGQANVIRFHHEALIHPEHEHMMLSPVEEICGAKMRKTSQWSQRPHLASAAFYRDILERYFSKDSKAFIEHGVYGPMVEAYNIEGIMGWNLWKVYIFHPDGQIQRSYNLNGRGDGLNFESTF